MAIFSCTQGADTHSTGKLLVAIISICFENKKWDHLNENLVLLTKRRGQIKQVSFRLLI
jgi:26S proteasome regulatory subunit N5